MTKIKTNEADLQLSQFEIEQNSELAITIGVLLDELKNEGSDSQLISDFIILLNEVGYEEPTSNQQSSFDSIFAKLSNHNQRILYYLVALLRINMQNSKQVSNHTLWMNCCAYFPEVFLSSILLYFIYRCFY